MSDLAERIAAAIGRAEQVARAADALYDLAVDCAYDGIVPRLGWAAGDTWAAFATTGGPG